VTPFLRWAGGKRWIAPRLAPILATRISRTYHEPFLGSGAIFFALTPLNALLSDTNEDLINAYHYVRRDPHALVKKIRSIPVNSKAYYRVRSSKSENNLDQAVRFIYLNRTCYGGLHRTNKQGNFNTPYGGGSRTPEILWRDGVLEHAARTLASSRIKIRACDFRKSIEKASYGDVVYCDPVYTTRVREQFDRYNSDLFGWTEQLQLREAAYRAFDRGALVVISNAFSADICALFPSAFRIPVERKKCIGRKSPDANRGIEYLIILDPEDRRSDWLPLGAIERRISRRHPEPLTVKQVVRSHPDPIISAKKPQAFAFGEPSGSS
jgi:DNA adenine methylase